MPGPLWWYDCSCRESCGGGSAKCLDCGRPGRFVGYTKSVVEHWATFRRVTGLNPLADKSSPEDRAILARVVRCGLCRGSGYLSNEPGTWANCPRCLSDGSALDGKFCGESYWGGTLGPPPAG